MCVFTRTAYRQRADVQSTSIYPYVIILKVSHDCRSGAKIDARSTQNWHNFSLHCFLPKSVANIWFNRTNDANLRQLLPHWGNRVISPLFSLALHSHRQTCHAFRHSVVFILRNLFKLRSFDVMSENLLINKREGKWNENKFDLRHRNGVVSVCDVRVLSRDKLLSRSYTDCAAVWHSND